MMMISFVMHPSEIVKCKQRGRTEKFSSSFNLIPSSSQTLNKVRTAGESKLKMLREDFKKTPRSRKEIIRVVKGKYWSESDSREF